MESGGRKMPDSRAQLKIDVRDAHLALRVLLPSSTTFTVSDAVQRTRVYRELILDVPQKKTDIYAGYRTHLAHMGAIVAQCPLEISEPRAEAHLLALLFISAERSAVSVNLLTFIDDL